LRADIARDGRLHDTIERGSRGGGLMGGIRMGGTLIRFIRGDILDTSEENRPPRSRQHHHDDDRAHARKSAALIMRPSFERCDGSLDDHAIIIQ